MKDLLASFYNGSLWGVALFLFFPVLDARAQQVDDQWGVRITWPANPEAEQIDNYSISWQDNNLQTWVKFADVAPTNPTDDLSIEYRLAWLRSSLQVGDEICISIRAHAGELTSPASDRACITINDPSPEIILPTLTTPAVPELVIIEQVN